MMNNREREQLIALIKREVVPATGCTEPVAVSLCVAKATELLGKQPDRIEVKLSANILKNAMGVGIPGTGMIGLPIAVALGAIAGKSAYQLEVLKEVTPEAVEKGKKMIDNQQISIALKEGIEEKLYIETSCYAGQEEASAIIAGTHTHFVYLSQGHSILLQEELSQRKEAQQEEVELTLRKVHEFATTSPLEELSFILESKTLNKRAAEISLQGEYGHQLGRILGESQRNQQILGNNTFTHILSYTSAACDARMGGAMIPVMSNSGSGNQGITATLPVVVFAEEQGNSEEELIRALILSHLTVIYIKQQLGRLSALCGCVVAATGSSCGITYLMGGNYEKVSFAVQNMIANLTGMICDGAKPSCALKLSSGVSTALLSAILAMENKCVTSVEGIIQDDVDKSIKNLTRIGTEAMNETDRMVLEMMTNKQCD
ncbi:MAG: serine dehydratase subunit alpha family protein [Phocaeicola sp.]